jgi:putative ABC transport system permease protein
MWRVSFRDLAWRRRRFVVAVLAAALVFGLTLLMDGITTHMENEIERVVDRFDADEWLVAEGGSGPFTTARFLPTEAVEAVREQPGVEQADLALLARETVDEKWTNIIGYTPGGLGEPKEVDGARIEAPGQAVVDSLLGYEVGDTIVLGGRSFDVVGTASDLSFNFGAPTVLLDLDDVRELFLAGQPLASSIAVKGTVDEVPDGMQRMSNDEVKTDLRRGLEDGLETIVFVNVLLWVVAAGIIGSIVYLTALERVRDFAVMKATGASNGALVGTVASGALVLAVTSAIAATVLAAVLAPLFPIEVEIKASSYVLLVIVSLVVGLLASLAGLRRAVRVDPALAFGAG